MNWRETIRNKIIAVIFIVAGWLSCYIDYDATFFVFSLMCGVPLFFARRDCFKD